MTEALVRGARKRRRGNNLNEGTRPLTWRTGAINLIYVSPGIPAFCDWAFAYAHKEDRFNELHHVVSGPSLLLRIQFRKSLKSS